MKAYRVISNGWLTPTHNGDGLEEQVNALLDEGYVPVGGLCFGKNECWAQAMYKKPAMKKPKARTAKKHEYPLFFENLWCEYPKVSGANKRKAYAQFCQRIKEGIHSEDMLAGTVSYDALCKATDRTVMLPATFFGRDKHFNCDWTIPKKKPTEDPNKQHHPDFDPDADTTIGLDPVNPYEDM